ncbi:MAG: hypothetical protein H0W48_00030 [Methylibium sp.]|nr:hypothetical protein [Methylibium sp.]
MTLDDLHPWVLPFVPDCPSQTVNHHLLQAAIEFCSRTLVWKERLDTVLADGFSTRYTLALDDQIDIAKIYTVQVGLDEATVVESLDGAQRVRDGTSVRLAWTDNRRDINVHPVPADAEEISVVAALKPARTAFSLPDVVFVHHMDDVANGALARLLSMPKQTWSDLNLAQMAGARFQDAITSAARHASGGFARRTPRCKSTRFF